MKSQYRQYRAVREPAPRAVRRRRAAAVAGGVLVALLASIIGLDSASNGGRVIAAVAAAAKDPASLFDSRSPGARGGGALQQTKGALPKPAPAFSHREGAKPPPPAKAETAITYAPEDHPEVAPPSTAIPVTLAEEAPTPAGDFAVFSGIDGQPPVGTPGGGGESYVGSPPGGGGGGGGGGVTTLTTTPVPEPSVWAMLIVGFFSVGGMMRAQRRAAQPVLVRANRA